jgi:squalene monooxygenase
MSSNVVVVGGGFAGLAAAAALVDGGNRVTILEQHQGIDSRFRGELIHPHGVRALARLGLLAPLRAAGGVPVSGFVVVVDGEGAPALLPYGAASGEGLGIEHPLMVRKLREVVSARARLVTGRRVLDWIRDGERVLGVRDDAGGEHRADLTVVADGSSSRLRKGIGLDAEVELLSYTVALAVEGDVLPHPGFGHVLLGGPGPILAYPFGEGKVRLCIDVPRDAPRGKAALAGFVREAYAAALPEPLRGAMLAAVPDMDVCANHRVHTRRCAVPGAVLLGDAGGCSHPVTATGMTSALNDATTLAETLGDLGEYERRRYRFVRPREVLADAVYEVLRAGDEGSRAMRGGIMRYWRDSERARTRSIGILSGEISDIRSFVTEYTLVTGLAALGVWGGVARAPALGRRTRETRSLFRTALGRIGRTLRHTRS